MFIFLGHGSWPWSWDMGRCCSHWLLMSKTSWKWNTSHFACWIPKALLLTWLELDLYLLYPYKKPTSPLCSPLLCVSSVDCSLHVKSSTWAKAWSWYFQYHSIILQHKFQILFHSLWVGCHHNLSNKGRVEVAKSLLSKVWWDWSSGLDVGDIILTPTPGSFSHD